MAGNDSVDITVKINDEFSGTLERLRQQLESIDHDVLQVILNMDTTDLKKLKAELEAVDGTVTESTHVINQEEGDRPPPDFVASNEQSRKHNGDFGQMGIVESFDIDKHSLGKRSPLPDLHESETSSNPLSTRRGQLKNVVPNGLEKKGGKSLISRIDEITGKTSKLDGRLKSMMPTMRKWMNLIAALVPMMISWGTAALGVASAIAAVAAAGGAMVGLGLMGMDDSEERLKQFKEDLKSTFEPVSNAFQPIAESVLSEVPRMLSDVARELRGITAFKDTFMQGLRTIIESVGFLIERMTALEPIISQLTNRFLGMITSGIVELFTWLVEEAWANQEAMLALGGILMKVLRTVYNLATAVSEIAIEFGWLFDVILGISEILNNDLITGAVAVLGKLYLMIKTVGALVAVLRTLKAVWMSTPLGLASGLVAMGAGALISGSGKGTPIVGAGTSDNGFGSGGPGGASGPGMGSSSRGGDTYYTMNVDGNVTDRHVQKFRDMEKGHRQVEQKDYKRMRGSE